MKRAICWKKSTSILAATLEPDAVYDEINLESGQSFQGMRQAANRLYVLPYLQNLQLLSANYGIEVFGSAHDVLQAFTSQLAKISAAGIRQQSLRIPAGLWLDVLPRRSRPRFRAFSMAVRLRMRSIRSTVTPTGCIR